MKSFRPGWRRGLDSPAVADSPSRITDVVPGISLVEHAFKTYVLRPGRDEAGRRLRAAFAAEEDA